MGVADTENESMHFQDEQQRGEGVRREELGGQKEKTIEEKGREMGGHLC